VVGNLPVRLTRVVGREEALAELSSLVWRTRLLSLCGPGGNGKTRLAVALAGAVREDFVGGAWWADLSTVFDPGLVGQAVASALYPGAPAGDPRTALAQLFTESSLLVLDNCEQIAEASAAFVGARPGRHQRLRSRCPGGDRSDRADLSVPRRDAAGNRTGGCTRAGSQRRADRRPARARGCRPWPRSLHRAPVSSDPAGGA
jgi:hypothetical protein